ncbi:MAG: DUF5666 domain-containing protein [Georgfuchsia sp.]
MIEFSPGEPSCLLRRWLCAIVLGVALPIASWATPACLVPNGGIGGTGAPMERGGIGGTGIPAERGGVGGTGDKESLTNGGLGGTGQLAKGGIGGTGIVGIITGFGSVCVDGLEVEYDPSIPVSINGAPATTEQLALGQVVAIDASGVGTNLVAKNISIVNALEGPITKVRASIGVLYVMEQRVRITTDTTLAGVASLYEATDGQSVRVSGYRNADNEVVASRIEAVSNLPVASVVGMVTSDRADTLTVSGLPVRSSAPPEPSGTEMLVRGTWDGERLDATSTYSDPSLPFAGHVERVVIEGLVLKRLGANQVTINGFNVTLSAEMALRGGDISDAKEGRRIRVSGRLGPGRQVTADHLELMPKIHMGSMNDMGHGRESRMPRGMTGGMFGSPGGMSFPGGSMGGGGGMRGR